MINQNLNNFYIIMMFKPTYQKIIIGVIDDDLKINIPKIYKIITKFFINI